MEAKGADYEGRSWSGRRWLGLEELRIYLGGVAKRTVRDFLRSQGIKPMTLHDGGRRVVVDRRDIDLALERRKREV